MLKAQFEIQGHLLKSEGKPFVIAEMGSNHNQNYDQACRLIDAAVEAGADAVKLQLFEAAALYPPGTDMYKIFKQHEVDKGWIPRLLAYAAKQDIVLVASAFDKGSVDWLVESGAAVIKLASSEATNLPLLAHAAAKKVPLIVSVGMCDVVDIAEMVAICEAYGNGDLALLQCGAVYPLSPAEANLRVMDALRLLYPCPVGFSDHTLGLGVSVAAVARGACIIEKHLTLDKKAEGPDHFYALEPKAFAEMVTMIGEAYAALGTCRREFLPDERAYGRREGLYAASAIAAGATITEAMVAVKRPATGLRARYKGAVLGARATQPIEDGAPLFWHQLEL